MTINNGFNILPWYDSLEKQNSKKWYAFGQSWPLVCPQNTILPFQFVSSAPISIDSNIYAVNLTSGLQLDLGVKPSVIESTQEGSNYYIVRQTLTTTLATLPVGRYYFKMESSVGTLYSEEIVIVDNTSEYIKLEYWNEDNLYFTSGEINFDEDFRFVLYIPSTIGKPEYEFEEELTKRLGYKFIESQTSNKIYKFNFLAPEYICDAMRLVRMCDYIKLTTKYDTYNALSFSYEPKWQDNGDLAAVDVEFDTDCIIQKLESFNRRLKESFYNALLADIDEPILFSTDTVAQYYTEFTTTSYINGKLIRQLEAISEDELSKSIHDIVFPIDIQSDTNQVAKKVFLSSIISKFAPQDDLSKYLLKSVWDSVFELRNDIESGKPYIYGKLPVVLQYGLTMYSGDGVDIPSIYEGLPIDNDTIYWEDGILKAKAGTEGSITEITSSMVISALGYTPASATALSGYLPLTGGELIGKLQLNNGNDLELKANSSFPKDSGDIVFMNASGDEMMRIWFHDASGNAGIRFGSSDSTKFLLHVGNYYNYAVPLTSYTASDVLTKLKTVDGSGSGLDADLLDGKHNGELTALYVKSQNVTTDDFSTYLNTYGNQGLSVLNNASGSDVGDISSISAALNIGSMSNRLGRFIFARHDQSDGLYWQSSNSAYNAWGTKRKVAFVDSNVASATKLQTARTIWGQSFDGTGDIDGKLILNNNIALCGKATDGTDMSVLQTTANNNLSIGLDTSAKGYSTYISGNNIYIRYGTSRTTGIELTSAGRVSIKGNVDIPNNKSIYLKDSTGTDIQMLIAQTNNDFVLGGGTCSKKYWTLIKGYKIAFYTAESGTRAMLINDSGNITIGAGDLASTTYKLYVNGGLFSKSVKIGGAQVTDNSKNIEFLASDDSVRARISYNGNTTDGLWHFDSAYAHMAMATRSGINFGVGTTTPEYKLDINGTTRISASTNIGLQIDSTYKGEVTRGVQVLNPSMPFGDANGVVLLFGQSTSAYNCGNIAYRHHGENNTNNYVSLGLYGKDNILVCKASGNVGIDNLNPTAKLHVNGTVRATNYIYSDSLLWFKQGSEGIYIGHNAICWHNSGAAWVSNLIGFESNKVTINQSTTVQGDFLSTGGITMYSARKLKTIQDERGLSLEELSTIKPTRFTWKDGRDSKVHIGGIADDVMKVLPEVIYKTDNDTLTMDYGNAAFAISASLIKPVISHEEEIKALKNRIKELEEQVKTLSWNIE